MTSQCFLQKRYPEPSLAQRECKMADRGFGERQTNKPGIDNPRPIMLVLCQNNTEAEVGACLTMTTNSPAWISWSCLAGMPWQPFSRNLAITPTTSSSTPPPPCIPQPPPHTTPPPYPPPPHP